VATDQDAARERVLAARAQLAREVELLGASGRAAVDIPARVKESPAKAAALVGGVGFLALKGPQRLYRAARTRITGKPARMPRRMLPDEIEKTLRKLGDDGDKVRGTLERDFAGYVKQSQKDRKGMISIVLLAVARPLLARGARAAGDMLFAPTPGGLSGRLEGVRARASAEAETARDTADRARQAARERIEAARGGDDRTTPPNDEAAPTGI
jgi:hypothetical protein